MRMIVIWSMLGLLVLVGANPTITIVRNLFRQELTDESREKPISTEGQQQGKEA